jgi:hypothetical protein
MVGVTGVDAQGPEEQTPGFGERGRMRRRARFLRKARELALRDLGGLVLDMHRFGQQTSQALLAKLATLRQLDAELRALESALGERRGVTVLREVGIAACPRCAAIHGRDDRFCPGCGLAFDSHADRPISTSPVSIPSPGATIPAPETSPPAASPPKTSLHETPPSETSPPEKATPTPLATPPIKPTAPPVAARPPADGATGRTVQAPDETSRETKRPGAGEEDQPTEILRPPVGGG